MISLAPATSATGARRGCVHASAARGGSGIGIRRRHGSCDDPGTMTTTTTTTRDTIRYDDAIVRKFVTATIGWGAIGMLVGLWCALQLAMPRLNFAPYFTFGRIRPLHTNAVIFAFAGNAIPAHHARTLPLFVEVVTATFEHGQRRVHLRIFDDEGFERIVPVVLLG